MTKRDWKYIAEIAGIVAIIASLLFVGFQLQQDRRIAMAQHEASLFQARHALNQTIIDNAQIWARGNSGEELSGEEAIVFRSIVDIAVGRAFSRAQSADELGAAMQREIGIESFAIWLHQHPVAREIALSARNEQVRARESIRDDFAPNFFWRTLEDKLQALDEVNRN